MIFIGQSILPQVVDQTPNVAIDDYEAIKRVLVNVYDGEDKSRIAQAAIARASSDTAVKIAEEINVQHLIECHYANYFLQQLIVSHFDVVSEVILRKLKEKRGLIWTSCHRFGCRIMCRIAEKIAPNTNAEKDFVEMLTSTEGRDLPFKYFGRFVVIACMKSDATLASQTALKIISDSQDRLVANYAGRLCLEEATYYDKRLRACWRGRRRRCADATEMVLE